MTILLHVVTVACTLYVTTFHGLLLIVTTPVQLLVNLWSVPIYRIGSAIYQILA